MRFGVLAAVIATTPACGSSDAEQPAAAAGASGASAAGGSAGSGNAGQAGVGGDGGSGGSATGGAAGAAGDAGTSGLGSVAINATTCASGNGVLPNTTCTLLSVSCPGIDPLDVELRETAPATGVPERGSVVFGIGGGGTAWYGGQDQGPSTELLQSLVQKGFRVFVRRWVSEWEQGPGGMAAVSCRYATLITWIRERKPGGAFCVSGNSGGSSEIAYALAHWGRGEIIDLAVPTGGPPMGRIDKGCLDGESWCSALIPSDWQVQPICGYFSESSLHSIDIAYTPDTPCADRDQSARELLHADSVVADGATLHYPKTKLEFIWGKQDGTYAVASGLEYANAVTSDKKLTFVPDVGHSVMGSTAGAQAIGQAIESGCTVQE
jgi:hypothetical protein